MKHPHRRFPPLLRSCWIKLNATLQKRLQGLGITPDQYIALRWMHEMFPQKLNQVALAKLMYTDANNISGLISRMENEKLVERTSSINDKRQKTLNITPHGKSKFLAAQPIAQSLEKEVVSSIVQKNQDGFLLLLCRLNRLLNKNF
jgi:DNA-binding MarR family transcriptional regulator